MVPLTRHTPKDADGRGENGICAASYSGMSKMRNMLDLGVEFGSFGLLLIIDALVFYTIYLYLHLM